MGTGMREKAVCLGSAEEVDDERTLRPCFGSPSW